MTTLRHKVKPLPFRAENSYYNMEDGFDYTTFRPGSENLCQPDLRPEGLSAST
jgi:hypothetical protein